MLLKMNSEFDTLFAKHRAERNVVVAERGGGGYEKFNGMFAKRTVTEPLNPMPAPDSLRKLRRLF